MLINTDLELANSADKNPINGFRSKRRMSGRRPLKKSGSDHSRRRRLFGATIIVTVAIVAAVVGILIGAEGVGSALQAIFSGTIFIVILMLYWFRSEKRCEHWRSRQADVRSGYP